MASVQIHYPSTQLRHERPVPEISPLPNGPFQLPSSIVSVHTDCPSTRLWPGPPIPGISPLPNGPVHPPSSTVSDHPSLGVIPCVPKVTQAYSGICCINKGPGNIVQENWKGSLEMCVKRSKAGRRVSWTKLSIAILWVIPSRRKYASHNRVKPLHPSPL